jgi:hypothetical protein
VTPQQTNGARRWVSAGLAVLVGLGLTPFIAAPAAAEAAVGYVRLAHLSPDTPKVDVYLAKVGDSSFAEQKFEHVGYGIMSSYLPLPVGTYAVSMRKEGDPASNPPVLTTQVTVEAGAAYTVAGVGKFAGLGLKVLNDDLSRPTDGKAKVRVIQASITAPVLDVLMPNGVPIATAVNFASTTSYQLVTPGSWELALKPTGSNSVSHLYCSLAAGSVYSLLVLDNGTKGLKLELRADARGGTSAPDGGVQTGAGGSTPAAPLNPLVMIAAGFVVLVGLTATALRLRRLAHRRA